MRTQEETAHFLAERIGNIYFHRPLMYGGSAEGVDLLLYTLHETWAFMMDLTDAWRDAFHRRLHAEDCGSAGFPTRYAMNNPTASDEQTAAYVVEQWLQISTELRIPIPREAILADLAAMGVATETDRDAKEKGAE